MSDCFPSAPLTYSTFDEKPRFRASIIKPRTKHSSRIVRLSLSNPLYFHNTFQSRTRNGGFHSLKLEFMQNGVETDRRKSKNRTFALPEKIFDELGFVESSEKGLEFETTKDEKMRSDPLNSTRKEEEIRTDDSSVSSTLDFLELENDLDREKRNDGSLGEEEELVGGGGSQNDESRPEEIERFDGKLGLRKGRQVIRRSNVIAKQVISVQSALSLGFVSQLWVDTCSWIVLVVEVRPSMLSGEMERFILEDVCQVGDFVLVEDEGVLDNDIKMVGLDTLINFVSLSVTQGYNVVTPSRRSIGKVRGYTFNINSGAVELLELDSFGVPVIPSSLVSTYALFVEDVVDVESDTVVVHEAAASRVQRLTKGFWDTPNSETFEDELEEYPNLEKRPGRSNTRRGARNFTSKVRETEDDLQLPMDYL